MNNISYKRKISITTLALIECKFFLKYNPKPIAEFVNYLITYIKI